MSRPWLRKRVASTESGSIDVGALVKVEMDSQLIDQLVWFLIAEPVHLNLNPQFGRVLVFFLDLFQNLTTFILLVIGDVPVDSEAPVVTS
jgi:hypothetical protein